MAILLVQSDAILIDVLAFTLERDGHEVLKAFDAAGAIRQCQQRRPELIIVDASLREGEGWAICQALGNQTLQPSVPLVLLTETRTDAVRGLNLGAVDCIVKPFIFSEFSARVRLALNHNHPKQRSQKERRAILESA
jgi:DNA-binding response OmpR family regulator